MSDENTIIEIGGERFGTGLLLPPDQVRPMTFAPLPDKFLLTKQQIQERTENSNRTPRREIFAGSDWIWSQGSVGSCNGQSQVGAVMRVRHLHGMPYERLSGSALYALMNGGRDRGSALEAGRVIIEKKGCPPKGSYKDNGFYTSRDITPDVQFQMTRFRVETYRIDTEEQLASGLAQDMIAVICVHAGRKYSQLDRNGVRLESVGKGNHSVGACDVRVVNGVYQFDEFGSWGLRNGQGGYAWLQWERHLALPNKYHSNFLIHTARVDDENRMRIS